VTEVINFTLDDGVVKKYVQKKLNKLPVLAAVGMSRDWQRNMIIFF